MLRTDAGTLVLGQLEPWTALTGHSAFGRLSADVGAAVLFVHAAQAFCKKEEWSANLNNIAQFSFTFTSNIAYFNEETLHI